MINWNLGKELVIEGFEEVVSELAQEITYQIRDPKWQWPRETRRQNGMIVGSPRDIVDTKELKNSQFVNDVSDTYKVVGYAAPHAPYVHEGYEIERADGEITDVPARPFIDTAVEDYNLLESYADIMRGKIG
jgi:hypothetical protein